MVCYMFDIEEEIRIFRMFIKQTNSSPMMKAQAKNIHIYESTGQMFDYLTSLLYNRLKGVGGTRAEVYISLFSIIKYIISWSAIQLSVCLFC